jgi:hypothetical protein
MIRYAAVALCSLISVPAAMAQTSPPTYEADPSTFKIIFEDQNFRVISATWKAGATDKAHSHNVPTISVPLTDCTLKLTSADGKTVTVNPKAGTAVALTMTPSHTSQNVGSADCRGVFVERK